MDFDNNVSASDRATKMLLDAVGYAVNVVKVAVMSRD
jgi:hypothetical protein